MKDNPLVLVVDDECGDRFIIREALEQNGFDGVEAENGQGAMEAFDRLCPDLVLLDVHARNGRIRSLPSAQGASRGSSGAHRHHHRHGRL